MGQVLIAAVHQYLGLAKPTLLLFHLPTLITRLDAWQTSCPDRRNRDQR